MKLELKHLAPYLPYGLKCEILDYKSDYVGIKYDEIIGCHQWSMQGHWCLLTIGGSKPSLDRVKPILHPLSDLTKEIEHKGERFVPIRWFEKEGYFGNDILRGMIRSQYINIQTLPFCIVQKLYEWHFDIEWLIENNLAIDINKLN